MSTVTLYGVRCDEPGCDAEAIPFAPGSVGHARALAADAGWYYDWRNLVPTTRGERRVDLCPLHRPRP